MDLANIFSIVFLVLDILIGVSFVFALLGGLARGLHKTIHRIIVLMIPVLILFIFLKPITNSIVDKPITIPDVAVEILPSDIVDKFNEGPCSIKEIITDMVVETAYPNDPSLKENSALAEAAVSISKTVVMILVYIIGVTMILFIRWVLMFVFWIIRKILHIKIQKKAHLLGMASGLALFIINFILIYLPIFGLVSLGATVVKDIETYQTQLEMDADLGELKEFTNAYDKSVVKNVILTPITKIFCKDKSATFDAQYVANSIWIETKNGDVKLYEEYSNIKDTIPTIIKISKFANELENSENSIIDLSYFDEQDVLNISKLIKESQLLRIGLPVGIEYATYELKTEENKELFEQIKNINWDTELNALADLIEVVKNHLNIKVNLENLEALLSSNEFISLVKNITDKLFNLSLVTEIGLPIAMESIYENGNLKEYEEEYNLDFSLIKTIDWKTEGKEFVLTLINVSEILINASIDLENYENSLDNPQLPQIIDDVIFEISNSTFITDKLMPILVKYAAANAKTSDDINIDLSGLESVNWQTNLPAIGTMLKTIISAYQVLDIDLDNFKESFKNPQLQVELDKVVTSILNIEVVSNYLLPLVMNELCESLIEDNLSDFNLNIENIKKTNWTAELNVIKDVLVKVLNAYQELEFDKENWTLILDDPNLSYHIKGIVDESLKSKVLKEEFIPSLAEKLNKLLSENGSLNLDFLNDVITKENIVDLLSQDTEKIISVAKELKKIGLIGEEETSLDFKDENVQKSIINIIELIFDLSVIQGKEAQVLDGILESFAIKEQLISLGIQINYENVNNWDLEIEKICTMFTNIMSLSGDFNNFNLENLLSIIEDDNEKEKVAEIIEAFATCQIFGDSIYDLINKQLENYSEDYKVTFTQEDKIAIESETGWKNEINILLDIFEDVEPILGTSDYKTLDADFIKSVMLKASNGVVASKILGTELNKIFEGVIDEDFTKRDTLKTKTDVVYNAIKLSKMVNDENFDLESTEEVSELVTTISDLAKDENNLELVNQFVNEIVQPEEELNLSQEQINETADIVEDVFNTYQNSDNKEEFTLDDLSDEQKEKLENSEFAELILDYFFKKN